MSRQIWPWGCAPFTTSNRHSSCLQRSLRWHLDEIFDEPTRLYLAVLWERASRQFGACSYIHGLEHEHCVSDFLVSADSTLNGHDIRWPYKLMVSDYNLYSTSADQWGQKLMGALFPRVPLSSCDRCQLNNWLQWSDHLHLYTHVVNIIVAAGATGGLICIWRRDCMFS